MSTQLLRLDTQILDHQRCRGIVGNGLWFDENKMCTLAQNSGAVCGGDSGQGFKVIKKYNVNKPI
jgi:hypothetical protein